MTAIFTLPGVLVDIGDTDPLITYDELGYPTSGLAARYRFLEAAGTVIADDLGGPDGVIEHPTTVNNAFSHLANGGIELQGTELATLGEFDAHLPWTIFINGSVTGSVGGVASERVTSPFGFRDWSGGPNYGPILIMRGGNDWTTTSTANFMTTRAPNGSGAPGLTANLLPAAPTVLLDRKRLLIASHDGAGNFAAQLRDGNGDIITSGVQASSLALLFTQTGTTKNTLKPTVGGLNASYAGGIQQVESFHRYTRPLADFTADEIDLLVTAAKAESAARGRPWA